MGHFATWIDAAAHHPAHPATGRSSITQRFFGQPADRGYLPVAVSRGTAVVIRPAGVANDLDLVEQPRILATEDPNQPPDLRHLRGALLVEAALGQLPSADEALKPPHLRNPPVGSRPQGLPLPAELSPLN
jgi:hypothetical protein